MRLTFGYEHTATWLQCEIEWYIIFLTYMHLPVKRWN
jgi:hypothetical protein